MLSSIRTSSAMSSLCMSIQNTTLEHLTTTWQSWHLTSRLTSQEHRTSAPPACPTSSQTSLVSDAGPPDGERTTGTLESTKTFSRKLMCQSSIKTPARISCDRPVWDTTTTWTRASSALVVKKARTLAREMAAVPWSARETEFGKWPASSHGESGAEKSTFPECTFESLTTSTGSLKSPSSAFKWLPTS